MLKLFDLFPRLYRKTLGTGRSVLYVLLALVASLLVLTTQVRASETILLQYRDLKTPIPLADLQTFVSNQETSSELQQFFQNANQDPSTVRQLLTREIKLPPLTQRIPSDFVLLQINKILGDPLGRDDLKSLKMAFGKTLENDTAFSVLEILQKYPKSEVRLEISRLEQVYADVNFIVTRIEPVLEVAKELLPELVCECNSAAELPGSNVSQTEIAYSQTRSAVHAFLPVVDTTVSTESAPNQAAQSLVALGTSDLALANKSLVIQFGPFSRSISLSDLTRFAKTGDLPATWRSLFKIAKVDPENLRSALNQETSVELRFLDKTLNSLFGEFLLYEVGQVVHTQSNTANIQALRTATVLSVAGDNRLSLLEVLQHYPTQQVYVDGVRLGRLGRTARQLQARGGLARAELAIEDWLVQLQASATENVCDCQDQQAAGPPPAIAMTPPTISADKIAKFLPANWQPVAPHREDRGKVKVVWLQGTPYEMGYQHGQYLRDEIATLGNEVLEALRFTGRGLALGRLAARRSYPEIIEECRGLTAATQDIGVTMDACLVLAYGDVYQEIFANTLPNELFWDGCSQWVAVGDATTDGQLYHGSSLDNDNKPINYIVKNPVVFVRQPNDGLPHVFISYPGVLWPNWGLNVAGITLGLDTAHPDGPDELALRGGSNVQIMAQILKTATTFTEARQIMETQPRVRANLIMITDGKSKEAGVFEFTGKSLGVRELQKNGVLYTTNHFVLKDMFDKQPLPLAESSLLRFNRFAQLMEPDGINTHYGKIDPPIMAKIGRDRVNPNTLKASPPSVFDDDASPGGNGSLRQGIYDPDNLRLWIAAGNPPVPENPFVCFSLKEMLKFPDATPCASPAL